MANKGTKLFNEKIKVYLDQRAQEDPLFAESYKKPNKNLDECITYIIGVVQKSGKNGFDDQEVYSMAVHYYDEDNIKPGKLPANMKVVVSQFVQLTPEEKEAARRAAIKQAQDEAYNAYTKRPKKAKKEAGEPQQPTLFG